MVWNQCLFSVMAGMWFQVTRSPTQTRLSSEDEWHSNAVTSLLLWWVASQGKNENGRNASLEVLPICIRVVASNCKHEFVHTLYNLPKLRFYTIVPSDFTLEIRYLWQIRGRSFKQQVLAHKLCALRTYNHGTTFSVTSDENPFGFYFIHVQFTAALNRGAVNC